MRDNMEPVEVPFETYRTEIGRLRATVWLGEGKLRAEDLKDGMWLDEFEDSSRHWAVFNDDNAIIASARLTVSENLSKLPYGDLLPPNPSLPAACLSRLVVHTDYRRRGIAQALDHVRLVTSVESGAKTAFGTVPLYREQSLQRLGFDTLALYDANANEAISGYRDSPTVLMVKSLS